jgi:hypothetical protein
MRLAPALLASAAIAGCTCGVPNPSDFVFACDAQWPCDAGYYCNTVGLCDLCDYDASEICDNGIDDNCDGLIDCQDPTCLLKSCVDGGFGNSVCCGTPVPPTDSSTACVRLRDDSSNCGACGISCLGGGSCQQGQCDCSGGEVCPQGQTCSDGGGSAGNCICSRNPLSGCPPSFFCTNQTCCPSQNSDQCGGGGG